MSAGPEPRTGLSALLRAREREVHSREFAPAPGITSGELAAEALRLARGDAAIAVRLLLHYARTR